MSDPIVTLASLEPESPPQAVVLSAVRLFRYRMIAGIAAVGVVVGGLILLLSSLQPDLDADVREVIEHPEAVHVPVSGSAVIATVRVTAVEAVTSPAGSAVRLVFEDLGSPEPEVSLDVPSIQFRDGEVSARAAIPSLSRELGRTSAATWALASEPIDLTGARLRVHVLPIPDAVFEEGGVLTDEDGFTGFVTIERNDLP